MDNVEIIVLAAGRGTRMLSSTPKVLHGLAGTALIEHVLAAANQVGAKSTNLVAGEDLDLLQQYITDPKINWVQQKEILGTGHATLQALDKIAADSTVLILYGDVPLIQPKTMQALLANAKDNNLALLTSFTDNPTGYGRIIRNDKQEIIAIVEEKDATEEQLQITEINTGILATSASNLSKWLPKLDTKNEQGEYYLTDIVAMAVADNITVNACYPSFAQEVQGVNTMADLTGLERFYQYNLANDLMASGVKVCDPYRIDIRGNLKFGTDVCIDINNVFVGEVTLGNGVYIGANCTIVDSIIGNGTTIASNSVIEGALIGGECNIGPFARVRPGTSLEDKVQIGNFVELKKAHLGQGSKANHLSYLGDTKIGKDVNIGAGTVTCNYDGKDKHTTTIADGAFVGSNSSLIAPVHLGEHAKVGAGSVISKAVPDGNLAVARSKQVNMPAKTPSADSSAKKAATTKAKATKARTATAG
jgi:bifunctional UDP-N-acetylglucosamine pyrophosphorylase / glucosamine-1-phosphate N-acetyltransferase